MKIQNGPWLVFSIGFIILIAAAAILVFGAEPTMDPQLQQFEAQKNQLGNEFERASKLLAALERMDAAQKAYREVLQKEQEYKQSKENEKAEGSKTK